MKLNVIILILLFIVAGNLNAQPGDRFRRLDNNFPFSYSDGVVVIDSTSQLNLVDKLIEVTNLKLFISLDTFPKEFKDFTKTKSLQIYFTPKNNITDLSFLVNFPNLEDLTLRYFKGEKLADDINQLTKLNFLWIDNADNLKNIDAISELVNLEKLHIRYCPKLNSFPKFDTNNQLKYLNFSELGDTISLANLNSLKQLEKIEFYNMFSFKEIPNDLSNTLKHLEINTRNAYGKPKRILEIKNLNNLVLYPNLKEMIIQGVYLKKITGNFSNLSLKNMELSFIENLTDISGLFTFNEIQKLSIKNSDLKTINPTELNTSIEYLIIDNLPNLTNISNLLKCKNIRNLQFKNAGDIKIPDKSKMLNFSIVSIFNKDFSFRFENNNY